MFARLVRKTATCLLWGALVGVTGGCDEVHGQIDLPTRDLTVPDLATAEPPPDLSLPWTCAALSQVQACSQAELIGCEPRFQCSGLATAMLCNLGAVVTDGRVSGELVAEDGAGRRHCTVTTTSALAPSQCEAVSCDAGASASTGTLTFYANQGTDAGTIPECRADNNLTAHFFDCQL